MLWGPERGKSLERLPFRRGPARMPSFQSRIWLGIKGIEDRIGAHRRVPPDSRRGRAQARRNPGLAFGEWAEVTQHLSGEISHRVLCSLWDLSTLGRVFRIDPIPEVS